VQTLSMVAVSLTNNRELSRQRLEPAPA